MVREQLQFVKNPESILGGVVRDPPNVGVITGDKVRARLESLGFVVYSSDQKGKLRKIPDLELGFRTTNRRVMGVFDMPTQYYSSFTENNRTRTAPASLNLYNHVQTGGVSMKPPAFTGGNRTIKLQDFVLALEGEKRIANHSNFIVVNACQAAPAGLQAVYPAISNNGLPIRSNTQNGLAIRFHSNRINKYLNTTNNVKLRRNGNPYRKINMYNTNIKRVLGLETNLNLAKVKRLFKRMQDEKLVLKTVVNGRTLKNIENSARVVATNNNMMMVNNNNNNSLRTLLNLAWSDTNTTSFKNKRERINRLLQKTNSRELNQIRKTVSNVGRNNRQKNLINMLNKEHAIRMPGTRNELNMLVNRYNSMNTRSSNAFLRLMNKNELVRIVSGITNSNNNTLRNSKFFKNASLILG